MTLHFKLLVCFLLLGFSSFADKIPGYYIKTNGDTVHTLIKVKLRGTLNPTTNEIENLKPDIIFLEKNIECYGEDKKKYDVYPIQAKEFGFVYEKILYRFLSRKDNLNINRYGDTYIFMKLEVDGYLKLFDVDLYNFKTGFRIDRFIVQKGDDPLVMLVRSNFDKQAADFFYECFDLSVMIRSKQYTIVDMKAIVEYYNEWYLEQQ